MMKAASNGKNTPRLITASLNTGIVSEVAKVPRPRLAKAKQAASAMIASIRSRILPAKPPCVWRVTFR
jgi:hypothetical protein